MELNESPGADREEKLVHPRQAIMQTNGTTDIDSQVRLARTSQEQLAAASLLLSDRALGHEVAGLIQGTDSMDGFVLAGAVDHPQGAGWLIGRPGPAALLVPPVVTAEAPQQTGMQLLEAMIRLARERGFQRIQAFVVGKSEQTCRLLEQRGFRCGGAFHYMAGDAKKAGLPSFPADISW